MTSLEGKLEEKANGANGKFSCSWVDSFITNFALSAVKSILGVENQTTSTFFVLFL